jgi:hypothetical protein
MFQRLLDFAIISDVSLFHPNDCCIPIATSTPFFRIEPECDLCGIVL